MTARADGETADEASIGRVTRALHWGSALLLVAGFVLAWTFSALGPTAVSARLVGVHRSVGLSLLVLTALRVTWRIAVPLPPLPSGTPSWEAWLARLVQAALYVCLLAMPVIGWFGSSAGGDAVSFLGVLPLPDLTGQDQDLADRAFQVHEMLGYAILALLSLHVAGALRHHFLARDGVLRRMVLGRCCTGGLAGGEPASSRRGARAALPRPPAPG